MRRVLALGLLLFLSLAAGASAAEMQLSLSDDLRLDEATLALGHLDPGSPELSDVHAVDVHQLDVPEGTLYVCQFQDGHRDEVPAIPTLQEHCRGEDSYENPTFEVGDRTWLVFGGNLSLEDPPQASTTLLAADTDTGMARLASVTAGSMGTQIDEEVAFRPQSVASQIHVEGEEDEGTYNGTDWVFYLEASGSATWRASGVHAAVPASTTLGLTPAGTQAMRDALDPHTLLDLQAASLGPDEREPVANATRLVGERTRLPPLVDGALLGHLNGTIGDRSFDPETVSVVGLSQLEGSAQQADLTGDASVRFTSTDAGFAPGLGEPAGVPWLGAALAWVLAGLTIALGPSAAIPNLRQRGLAAGAFLLALVAWDLVFSGELGASALSTMGEASLGVVLALGAFEVIAFSIAWLLLALPFVVVARRWLVDRLAVYAAPVATLSLLVFAVLRPGAIVAVGRLVAQL